MEVNISNNTIGYDSNSPISPITSTFEGDHESVTTSETEEDDGYESFVSDKSDNEEEEPEEEDDETLSVTSDNSELPSEYIIEDHEAEEDFVQNAERCPAHLRFLAQQKAGESHYADLPPEVKSRIAAGVFLPENQVIRIFWNHPMKIWTYGDNDNPYVQWGFGGLMNHVAREYLIQAPALYNSPYDILVDYNTAEFSFQYHRCGSREEDGEEYFEAMEEAASIVRHHNRRYQSHQIRALTLSWCPSKYLPSCILNEFNDIPGLEQVDLVTHAHYKRGNRTDFNLRDEEEEEMRYQVKYELSDYTFDVRIFNHWGVEIEVEDDD